MTLRMVVWHPLHFHAHVHTHCNPNEKQFLLNSTIWGRKTPTQHKQNEVFNILLHFLLRKEWENRSWFLQGHVKNRRKTEGMLRNISGHKCFPLPKDKLGHLSTQQEAWLNDICPCQLVTKVIGFSQWFGRAAEGTGAKSLTPESLTHAEQRGQPLSWASELNQGRQPTSLLVLSLDAGRRMDLCNKSTACKLQLKSNKRDHTQVALVSCWHLGGQRYLIRICMWLSTPSNHATMHLFASWRDL